MALYARESHHALTFVYSGHDPGVCCRGFSSLVLWQRGQGSRMSLVGNDLEHVGIVPGGLLAPAA
jgi:hypothetical protein